MVADIANGDDKKRTGELGEDLAVKYLSDRGYIVLRRNHRVPGGEIDIVARAPEGTLVFCEVKTITEGVYGVSPEDNLSRAKLHKMKLAAERFVASNRTLIYEDVGWRMDALAIELSETPKVRHYENVA